MTSKHWALVSGAVACLKAAAIGGVLLGPESTQAEPFTRELAFPGYSGFLNVPSSTVLPRGQADVQWSDQGFVNGRYRYNQNVSGAFGVFPYVEVGGRVIWDETHSNCYTEGCGIRDLSANVKLQVPLIPQDWFTLAAGIQDLGGETDDFEAVYLAAGRQFGPLEVTLGYGDPKSTVPRYLDGAFGAVSFKPFPWLNFMAEHDSQDFRVGAGVTSPQGWLPGGLQVKGKVMAYDRGEYADDRRFASIGISIPFGNAGTRPQLAQGAPGPGPVPGRESPASASTGLSARPTALEQKPTEANTSTHNTDVARIMGVQLVEAGYERVSTASVGDTLHVRWENNLYNRDERDALYDVVRRAQSVSGAHKQVQLTLLNQAIPVVSRTVSLEGEDALYTLGAAFAPGGILQRGNEPEPDWQFEGSYGPTWKPRLTFRPNISSGVATEYGVWDASVALGTELSASLWPGALVSASYNAEFYSSEDFERGGVFYNDRQRTDLIEAEIQQTLRLLPWAYTAVHAGRYAFDYRGVLNETMVLTPGGHHSLAFVGGYFRHQDLDDFTRRQALARYSYYNPNWDVQLDVYGGQFFAEDTGVRVDSRFWFGDYALTLQYKNTDAEFVSLGWVIPLTPVKDRQFKYLQLQGDADWSYSVQTRINEDKNITSFGGAAIVQSANPLREVYFNRGRLSNH
ncbi:MAG: YjbH domain-containing protein [Marinobacter sp.]|uniref:YjbH domain-containing protein n=1 Tax=Marinobacter sp. TaxID=50741 RepID=UPI00299F07F7|nr:YjbH domain-containing protein [Marinobacter sp.]MDX1756676.1 YjbH domain-containing protein [Marinobacter sp.]